MQPEPHIVDYAGISSTLIVAALHAVADSPGSGLSERVSEPVSLHVVQADLDAHQGAVYFDYADGRFLKLDITGSGILDATQYDQHNAGGAHLAQAIVDQFRALGPAGCEGLLTDQDGADRVADLARETLASVSPADSWRIGAYDRLPLYGPAQAFVDDVRLGLEFMLVRHLWVVADDLTRSFRHGFFDESAGHFRYVDAYDSAVTTVQGITEGEGKEYVLRMLEGVRSEIALHVERAEPSYAGQRDAWREMPERLTEILPMIVLMTRGPGRASHGDDLAR